MLDTHSACTPTSACLSSKSSPYIPQYAQHSGCKLLLGHGLHNQALLVVHGMSYERTVLRSQQMHV